MAIGGIGGNQPIDKNNQTGGIKRSEVKPSDIKIFDKFDTNSDQVIDKKDGEGFVAKFKAAIANMMGNNKTEETQPTGTAEDVKAATAAESTDKSKAEFDKEGNYKTDVTETPNGKEIKTKDGETLQVSKDGNSLSVKGPDGKEVSMVKTPDGGYEFKDEDGKVHKFDKDMNPKA